MTVALVALSVATVGAVGAATATASNGSLSTSPAAPGETATHTATVTVVNESTGSWNGLAVDYADADADVSEVGTEDVATVGIDRDDDASGATVDVNVSDDLSSVQTSNNGETLTVQFGGSYQLDAGDEVVVAFEDVQNPSETGDYSVPLDVNPQSSGGETSATLAIDGDSDGTTADDETTDGDTETETETETDGDESGDAGDGESGGEDGDSGGDSSGSSVPGFGVGLTLAAVIGAALLAVRE